MLEDIWKGTRRLLTLSSIDLKEGILENDILKVRKAIEEDCADVNSFDFNQHTTPIILAFQVSKGNITDITRYLAKKGADLYKKDSNGKSGWDYVSASNINRQPYTSVVLKSKSKNIGLER